MRRILVVLALSFMAAAGFAAAYGPSNAVAWIATTSASSGGGTDQKVTICHKVEGQGNTHNGYDIETVDKDSIANIDGSINGHGLHGGDIIPAFAAGSAGSHEWGSYAGQGDASWIDNNCAPPEGTTTTTTTTTGTTTTTTTTSEGTGHIIVTKQTSPDGATQAFLFETTYGNFSLSDGQSHDSGPLAPGLYRVFEDSVDGWTLTGSSCSGGQNRTRITLEAGQTVSCTVTNTQNTPPPPFVCPDGKPPEPNPIDPNDNCKRPVPPTTTTTTTSPPPPTTQETTTSSTPTTPTPPATTPTTPTTPATGSGTPPAKPPKTKPPKASSVTVTQKKLQKQLNEQAPNVPTAEKQAAGELPNTGSLDVPIGLFLGSSLMGLGIYLRRRRTI